ncbi:MAG: hypothetical protein F6K28_30335 [Microcoleus sp. SIO2G3]|nr:hypothetical protein [Microcoleus sp. SIO2G3]
MNAVHDVSGINQSLFPNQLNMKLQSPPALGNLGGEKAAVQEITAS